MGEEVQEFRADRLKYLLKGLASVAISAVILLLLRGDRLAGPAAVPVLVVLGVEALACFWRAAFQPQFLTVQLAPDWIFGPGKGRGIQNRIPRDEVMGIRRKRGRIVVVAKDGDNIVIRLGVYGSAADELARQVEAWSGGRIEQLADNTMKTVKIVLGCLTLLWAIRSMVLLPGALSHTQTAYGAGVAAGLIAAFITAVALTVTLFRSAFRKSKPRNNDAGSPA